MAIVRYENIVVNNLVTIVNDYGEQETEPVKWFDTRAKVADVSAPLRISDKYRIYYDVVTLTLNYTPNTKFMANNHEKFSILWRGIDWRITDIRETNDRMNVIFICYRNDPNTSL